jgi:DNA-binding XRE family transcriptional regulator
MKMFVKANGEPIAKDFTCPEPVSVENALAAIGFNINSEEDAKRAFNAGLAIAFVGFDFRYHFALDNIDLIPDHVTTLKYYRKRSGLTQRVLSDTIGCNNCSYIGSLETGARDIGGVAAARLLKMANAMQIPMEWLLF